MKLFVLSVPVLVFFAHLFALIVAEEKSLARIITRKDSLLYLVKFGYFGNPHLGQWDIDNLTFFQTREAIRRFQDYAGLEKTGVLDSETLKKMNRIRCGNIDIPVEEFGQLAKPRYRLTGGKWGRKTLTWKITRYPRNSKLTKSSIEKEVIKAFAFWSRETNLDFQKSTLDKVDFDISFQKRRHGDNNDFDGLGIVLAHAYPPPLKPQYEQDLNGDLHFDDDEIFVLKTSKNQDETPLLPVIVHELGHSLGLGHSEIRDSIMYSFMNPDYDGNFKLHRDDIRGIQELYGARKNKTTPSRPDHVTELESTSVTVTSHEDICKNPKFDAILTLPDDGKIYAFRDGDFIKFGEIQKKISIEEIDKIENRFQGVPPRIDGALNYNDSVYFFKGEEVWKFTDFKLQENYPKKISEDFPNIPNDIDGVFSWADDQNIYFFKYDKYWAFNFMKSPQVSDKFPLPLSQWTGIPNDIQAVFQGPNGATFFFKDNLYWKFDEELFSVVTTDPAYPRQISHMWLGCYNFRPEINDL